MADEKEENAQDDMKLLDETVLETYEKNPSKLGKAKAAVLALLGGAVLAGAYSLGSYSISSDRKVSLWDHQKPVHVYVGETSPGKTDPADHFEYVADEFERDSSQAKKYRKEICRAALSDCSKSELFEILSPVFREHVRRDYQGVRNYVDSMLKTRPVTERENDALHGNSRQRARQVYETLRRMTGQGGS